MSSGEVLALVVLHHSVSDGWSVGKLVKEISLCYDALLHGRDPGAALPPAAMQYSDYASFQRHDLLTEDAVETHGQYWRSKLGDSPAWSIVSDKPKIHPPPPENCGSVSFEIDTALKADLEAFCRQKGSTLFHLLLAAYGLLLCKHGS